MSAGPERLAESTEVVEHLTFRCGVDREQQSDTSRRHPLRSRSDLRRMIDGGHLGVDDRHADAAQECGKRHPDPCRSAWEAGLGASVSHVAGVRVLVSGMGGELGSRVASLLEQQAWVGQIEGIDADPPRRRLRRTVFHRIVPGQHDRTVKVVTDFNPHVVVHIAVWEPHARAATATARSLTDDAATSILGAAAECRSLESIIVRSGIEIYGRARGSVTRPSERVATNPTSEYGHMVAKIETTADADRRAGRRLGRKPAARHRARPARAQHARTPAPPPGGAVQPARRPTVRRDPPARRCRSVRRGSPRTGQRTAQHRGPGGDHRPPGDPPRPPYRGSDDRTGVAGCPGDRLPCGCPTPRPRARDAAPRPPGRQRQSPRTDRLCPEDHHQRRDRPVVPLAERRSYPCSCPGGGVMSNATQRLAEVITMPARNAGSQAVSVATGTVAHLRNWTTNEVDDWGRDDAFVRRIWSLSHFRWATSVGGVEHVPKRAGALIVVNARRFALAPIFASLAIGAAVGRPVRFVGRPDVAPIGPLMQRLGGLLPVEAELEGALRAGELVVLGANHTRTNLHTGTIDHELVGAAVAAKVRILPAATMSVPLQRNARVEIGQRIRLNRKRRGPLEELETADHLQAHINAVLDEMGGTVTGTPIDWLPNNWVGRI